jgi:Transposase DDE domain group 1
VADHRNPAQITHTMSDILRGRVFAIACGYPDADDLDDLRRDPAFKLACGRLPESGDDLHTPSPRCHAGRMRPTSAR